MDSLNVDMTNLSNYVKPSNAKATFIQSTAMQRFLKII